MNRTLMQSVTTGVLALVLAVPAVAQFGGPPPGGPPPGGPPQGMQAFRAWGESHRNIREVSQTIRGISQLEQSPAFKLNGHQAKVVLAVLTKWRTRPVMTNDQAGKVIHQMTGVLSPVQVKQLAVIQSQRRGFGGPGGQRGPGGPGGFGAGRPGGAGGPGAGRPGAPAGPGGFGAGRPGGPGGAGGPGGGGAFGPPKDYNPLNPATLPFERMRSRATQELNDLITALSATR